MGIDKLSSISEKESYSVGDLYKARMYKKTLKELEAELSSLEKLVRNNPFVGHKERVTNLLS